MPLSLDFLQRLMAALLQALAVAYFARFARLTPGPAAPGPAALTPAASSATTASPAAADGAGGASGEGAVWGVAWRGFWTVAHLKTVDGALLCILHVA